MITFPLLSAARREAPFELVTLCAVWQHLDDGDRAISMPSLADLTATNGTLIMSLRHGVGAADRRVFAVDVDATVESARRAGFTLLRTAEAASVQASNRAAGVRWTWLALTKAG